MHPGANPEPDDVGDLLTIDELSRRVGMTVRNLREWRTLGLVPPAEIRGRVGYYDASVVDRIEEIQKLHAQGFTLDLIRRIIEAGGQSGDEVMRLARNLRAPFRDSQPPEVDLVEWGALWGTSDPAQLGRATELGLIRQRPDGGLEFTSAHVAEVGRALHDLGLSLEEALDVTAAIREHVDGVADLFERVWLDHVWEPFIAAGKPQSELPALQETLAAVQPVAMDAVTALFTVAMEAKIESSIAREVERAARESGESERD